MKKYLRMASFFLGMMAGASLMVSCGDDDNDDNGEKGSDNNGDSRIVGTWEWEDPQQEEGLHTIGYLFKANGDCSFYERYLKEEQEEEQGGSTSVITTKEGLSYDLIVKLNMRPASITFGGKTASATQSAGNIYVFNGVDKTDVLVVRAPAGYKGGYNGVVEFGSGTAKYLNLSFYPDMTNASSPEYDATVVMAQSSTNAIMTTNSSANQSDNEGTVVSLAIPAGSGDVEGDDPFSIYLYTPGNDGTDELENVNDAAAVPVLAIACTPDGADWTTKPDDERPLVKAVLEKSSELDVKMVNSDNKAEALSLSWANPTIPDETSARIPHFSSWYYIMNAKVVNVRTEEVTLYENPQRSVTNGERTQIQYQRNLGVADAGVHQPLLIKKYIQAMFGNSATTIKSTYNYTPTMTGTATESIKQIKKTLTIKSKNYMFDVTVWGAVKPEITIYGENDTKDETPVHESGTMKLLSEKTSTGTYTVNGAKLVMDWKTITMREGEQEYKLNPVREEAEIRFASNSEMYLRRFTPTGNGQQTYKDEGPFVKK